MNPKFNHYILTPFNLEINRWRKKVCFNKAWMDFRVECFKQVTLPSIQSQTNQNFKWLVLCDADTPEIYHRKLHCRESNIEVIYSKNYDNLWRDVLKSYRTEQHLLTTRLDGDDALHEDFVKNLQVIINPLKLGIFNFLLGIITDGKKIYRVKRSSNPFASMLSTSPHQHIRTIAHPYLRRDPTFKQISISQPMWLTYIHGMNVNNALPEEHFKTKIDDLIGFNLKLPIMDRLIPR